MSRSLQVAKQSGPRQSLLDCFAALILARRPEPILRARTEQRATSAPDSTPGTTGRQKAARTLPVRRRARTSHRLRRARVVIVHRSHHGTRKQHDLLVVSRHDDPGARASDPYARRWPPEDAPRATEPGMRSEVEVFRFLAADRAFPARAAEQRASPVTDPRRHRRSRTTAAVRAKRPPRLIFVFRFRASRRAPGAQHPRNAPPPWSTDRYAAQAIEGEK